MTDNARSHENKKRRKQEMLVAHDKIITKHSNIKEMKEGNALFNDALNTFYLQVYGVGHMVKDHSYSKRGNLIPPLQGLDILFSIICTISQTG